jgi:hypothetical protein
MWAAQRQKNVVCLRFPIASVRTGDYLRVARAAPDPRYTNVLSGSVRQTPICPIYPPLPVQ